MPEFERFKQRTQAADLQAEPMSISEYKLRLDSLESGGAAACGARRSTPPRSAACPAPPAGLAVLAQTQAPVAPRESSAS